MLEPSIAVIIAARNEEKNILHCLENIPSYKKLEVILVDDASKDQTYLLARKFRGEYPLKILKNKTPKGSTYSWDLGVKHSSSDLIFLMAADAKINSFEKAVPYFHDPSVVLVRQRIDLGEKKDFVSHLPFIYNEYLRVNMVIFDGIYSFFKKNKGEKPGIFLDPHGLLRKSFYLKIKHDVKKGAGEEERFNDFAQEIVKKKHYKVIYEPKFIERREINFSIKRFLIQQKWYGRNAFSAFGLFDIRTFRKILRFFTLFFVLSSIIYNLFPGKQIFIFWIIITAIFLLRCFSGFLFLCKEKSIYCLWCPIILMMIIFGDLFYFYGFLESLIYKIFKKNWIVYK